MNFEWDIADKYIIFLSININLYQRWKENKIFIPKVLEVLNSQAISLIQETKSRERRTIEQNFNLFDWIWMAQ